MVARLTPDQKAACSNHVGVILLSYFAVILTTICIEKNENTVKMNYSSKQTENVVVLKASVFTHCTLNPGGGRNKLNRPSGE